MQKLISRYQDEPTAANAVKIRNYLAKHPMCRCLLTQEENEVVGGAIAALEG